MLHFQIEEFEWDEGNQYKSAIKHGVANEEAEEAFFDPDALLAKAKHKRYILLGTTLAGRFLTQVFEFKGKNIVRIISSRDMTRAERQRYERG